MRVMKRWIKVIAVEEGMSNRGGHFKTKFNWRYYSRLVPGDTMAINNQ